MNRLVVMLIAVLFLAPLPSRADQQLHHRGRYTLHAGDVFVINYRYTPEFNQTVTIQPDGYVTLDIVGDMKAAGLTLDQLHNEIVAKASSRLNNPEVNLTLKDFEHPYIVVAGAVQRPGKIELREDTTALQAVMLAGGFSESARDTRVILFRRINQQDAEVRELNLHKVTKTSDLERDTGLQPGDMLLVTRNKLEKFSRVMKATNLGLYFDPTTIPF
ncbi:polysaccharide biosynthesis/export family protein [Acidipila rosea]|uniref:Polysaccharide export outer membrane protein n=1 Tax=Acidipila rosea TaxID=768535 RepID=A0A4R1L253_9BACT|nr:polysaccharide biosynthesis/export family protein [Acidipila rosea]MBW4028586.1 polysaccharide export protein [Acidobacteriota bacterium]MBW4045215.1 polysaccharide export protein [Acidobacteriota bacterium]TCK72055.1 polysaccharide export outer membrane protein [Acidipila rosea]